MMPLNKLPRALQVNSQIAAQFYETVDSTQSRAKAQIHAFHQAPFWILAQEQTEGRGRQGKSWRTDKGNYAASLVWPKPQNIADAPKISLLTALALALTLEDLGIHNVKLKWPNDVLVNQKKISGILLEVEGNFLVIGVGVNLISYPGQRELEENAFEAAQLNEEFEIDFTKFHQKFEERILPLLYQFERFGFEKIKREYCARMLVRESLVLKNGASSRLVQGIEIGDDGQLIVMEDGVKREHYSGDLGIEELG